jgi:chaperone required for assembly of F1-ATPase
MKRFYKDVSLGQEAGGWRVLLDGRGIKTAAGHPQIVPNEAVARLLAGEWALQAETIDPQLFQFRDLADYAIDVVAGDKADVFASLVGYAETDTLCYRADPEEPLHRRQLEVWEPILRHAEAKFGVVFVRVSGIIHKPQPPESLARLKALTERLDPFTLAALRVLTSLSASLVIALLSIEPDSDVDALWAAANLEEEWQADLWGRETEAETRREKRHADFARAVAFAKLVR